MEWGVKKHQSVGISFELWYLVGYSGISNRHTRRLKPWNLRIQWPYSQQYGYNMGCGIDGAITTHKQGYSHWMQWESHLINGDTFWLNSGILVYYGIVICLGNTWKYDCCFPPWELFLDFCFPDRLLFCFSLLLCFSASLRFLSFCFSVCCFSLLLCFFVFLFFPVS